MAKFIDWSVIQVLSAIQVLTMLKPPANGRNPRLEEALQFLKGPDFIPAESQPARVEFNPDKSGLHFRFPTPRPGRLRGEQRRLWAALPLRGALAGTASDCSAGLPHSGVIGCFFVA